MNAITQSEIDQQVFELYDEYCHGEIDRREFLKRAGVLGAAALAMAQALLPRYARAQTVMFTDKRIKARYVDYPSPEGNGDMRGYLVTPAELEGTAGAVLVVHENRGLNPYIEDVARRLAKEGFIAFAPDALYPLGGYPGNDDEGRAMQRGMDRRKLEEDFIAAARFVKQHGKSNGKLGAVGFCFGGYIVNMLAAVMPDELDAAVPFYGTPAAEELRSNVGGPLMLHFGGLDTRVNATWPAYEAVLQANGADYVAYVYEGVNHGFHNDSTARYAPEEAELAWSRTVDFFKQHLAG
jgi:carboxymethylenebutenolidase